MIKFNEYLFKKYPDISITYLPITNQNILKHKRDRIFYNILFEAILERSADGFIDLMHITSKLPKIYIPPKKIYSLLICDKQAMRLAVRKNIHKNKIKILQKFIETYNLTNKDVIFINDVKHNKFYKLSDNASYDIEKYIIKPLLFAKYKDYDLD